MDRSGLRVVALIPAKALASAKSRLAPSLDETERSAIALKMLRNVVSAATSSEDLDSVGVISSDERVLDVARELGAQSIAEHGDGLNHALYLGRRWAMEQKRADALLILLSDLPLLTSEDVSHIVLAADEADVVIAPSKDGGTNALLLRPPNAIRFRFGPDSAARHQAEAGSLTLSIVDRPTLAFDVDTPEDVRTALEALPALAAERLL
jgi:2-phospho-L-lactate guanylyltransferase